MDNLHVHGIYKHACPNCGGEIDDLRLYHGLPCNKCLPRNKLPLQELRRLNVITIGKLLASLGNLKEYKWLYDVEKKLRTLEEFFKKATGSRFWSSQRMWARRVLRGKSFAIVAPTGVGKTLFGLAMALYFAVYEKAKSYIIVPTTPLVIQAEDRLNDLASKAGVNVRVLAIHSRISRKERGERLAKLQTGDFDILVTTSRFLQQNFNYIKGNRFKFLFVDDVDAVLKSSKSIDLLLMLMGFDENDLEIGLELVKARREFASAMSRGDSKLVKEISEKIESLERRLKAKVSKLDTVLIVSTATGRPRGTRVKLFRELLGFEVGSRSEFLRNITDSYIDPLNNDIEYTVKYLVEKLGDGGLVFVPIDKGVDYAVKLAEYISEHTPLNAKPFYSKEIKALEEFIEGKVNILVGVATYYGVMVRGIDLPARVRYAVFAGVPRLKFSTQLDDPHPVNIFRALTILRDILEGDERKKVETLIARLRRHLQKLSTASLSKLAEMLRSGVEPQTRIDRDFYDALKLVRDLMSREDVRRKLYESPELSIIEVEGKTYILVPDVMTYIQASGRTSRMFAGGLTYGLSVVIVDDPRLFRGLVKRMKWVIEDSEWVNFKELNLNEVLKRIDEDREKVRKVLSGEIKAEVKDLVKTALMVVESPNKARTIANFFGKPSIRTINDVLKVYEVTSGDYILMITASGGHVYDLVKEPRGFLGVEVEEKPGYLRFIPVYTSIKKCLVCGHQFVDERNTCPRCDSTYIKDSKDVVKALRELSSEVDLVLIGTDPDTEGEKIGWDIAVLLSPYTSNIQRIEFHEVTRKAINEALRSIREFNLKLVEAQIVRRVEDRWIGFTLSPLLWYEFWPAYCLTFIMGSKKRKKRDYKCTPGEKQTLSAGRVQTPVLGWVIDRFIEYKKNLKKHYSIDIAYNDSKLTIEFIEDELIGALPSLEVEEIRKQEVEVRKITEKVEELKPLPPFTTDTLLSEASIKYRLSATEVMNIAQELFEMGFITYHRTDSTRVSDTGINVAREYLREKYGDKYKEYFAPRTWGTGGAHEAIRPTRPIDVERLRELIAEGVIQPVRRLTRNHYLIYDLIFRRFIASQMKPAKIKKEVLNVKLGKAIKQLELTIDVIEPGFLEVYPIVDIVKEIPSGKYKIIDVRVSKRSTKPLYSQGDVVALMKKRKIGRPSTYAKIIQTIMQRGYVSETPKQKKLIATQLGRGVYAFLTSLIVEEIAKKAAEEGMTTALDLYNEFKELKKHISEKTIHLLSERVRKLVSEERTRILEQYMDQVEEGKRDYQDVLKELYNEVREISYIIQSFEEKTKSINSNKR